MAIDTSYIPAYSLNTIITNKDTSEPLSGGVVTFYKDSDQSTGKYVWQITGTSPNYTFVRLPNPMILSSTGTFVDELNNPVVPYFYPQDSEGAVDLYYVEVKSAGGVLQFDRKAVPHIASGGSSGTGFNANNEISNPQFVEVLFEGNGPITYSPTGTDTVTAIAPDWDIITSGTATVIVERLNNIDSSVESNPPYALKFTTSGLTSALQVRQRISNSPRLFSNEYVSSNAEVSVFSASSIDFKLRYVPSSGDAYDLIDEAVLPGVGFVRKANSTLINGTINTNNADIGYIDIIAVFDANTTVAITSIQISGTSSESDVLVFSEESTPRQIDQLYHYAYPIVPVGAVIDFAGFAAPAHYLFCNGDAYNRVTYGELFRALTTTETVTLTDTVNTFTVVSGTIYYIGMAITGTGIPSATTISAIVGTTVTMSAAATVTDTSTVTFYAWGAGDESTTFNIPNLLGYVTAGADGTLFGTGLNAVGYRGGSATHTLLSTELPPHTHTTSVPVAASSGGGSVAMSGPFNLGAPQVITSSNGPGASAAFSLAQLTANVRKYIRYE